MVQLKGNLSHENSFSFFCFYKTFRTLLVLKLSKCSIDNSVTVVDPTITSNASGASYQWLDCNNSFSEIPRETVQSFTATANGDYAVEVSEGGCTDTSDCITILKVGVAESTLFNSVSILPNPTLGPVAIDLGNLNGVSMKVFTVLGELIYQKQNIRGVIHQFEINESSGIYFIELSTQGWKRQYILVKQ